MPGFFPSSIFGGIFYLSLVGLCALIAAIDWKRYRIPNRMTVLMLAIGLVMNLIRGVWLGVQGEPGRYFQWTGWFGGLVEGFCFSAAGFAAGIGLFFVLWQLGTCGGGDVKLMAAIGAWVGPFWLLFVLLGAYVAIVLLLVTWWILAFLKLVPAKRAFSYAPAACLSVAGVMFWFWRNELIIW